MRPTIDPVTHTVMNPKLLGEYNKVFNIAFEPHTNERARAGSVVNSSRGIQTTRNPADLMELLAEHGLLVPDTKLIPQGKLCLNDLDGLGHTDVFNGHSVTHTSTTEELEDLIFSQIGKTSQMISPMDPYDERGRYFVSPHIKPQHIEGEAGLLDDMKELEGLLALLEDLDIDFASANVVHTTKGIKVTGLNVSWEPSNLENFKKVLRALDK